MVRVDRTPENLSQWDGTRGAVPARQAKIWLHVSRGTVFILATLWPVDIDTNALGKDPSSPWPSEQSPCKGARPDRAKPATEQSLRNSGKLKREDTK